VDGSRAASPEESGAGASGHVLENAVTVGSAVQARPECVSVGWSRAQRLWNLGPVDTTSPLLFTPERIAKARARRRPYSGPPLDRLILLPDWYTGPRRAQLERIAARVTEGKRARVLRPLDSTSAAGTINQLLLGATLEELGWDVEHEPQLGKQTPDFRIRKSEAEFLVEVVRVEKVDPFERAVALIRDAFEPHTSHRPISITAARIDGSKSLKRLVAYVRSLGDAAAEKTRGKFQEDGVFVAFHLHERRPEPKRMLFSWSPGSRFGDHIDDIREAIAAKAKRYKLPLIVALDLVGVVRPFEETQSALYGKEAFSIPVRMDGGELPPGVPEVSLIRLPDGPLIARGAGGKRARARLIGVLPFVVGGDSQYRFTVNAALLGTLLSTRELLEPFTPIPTCVPTAIGEQEATMTWFGGQGVALEHPAWAQWSSVPATEGNE
jgi:hypothetical protein